MATAAKRKPADLGPEVDAVAQARAALAAVFDELAALRAAFELSGRDIDAAREQIRATEKEIAKQEEVLAKAAALQKRATRQRIQDLKRVSDLRGHKSELEARHAYVPGSMTVNAASLEERIKSAESRKKRAIGDVLKAHPGVLQLIEHFHAKRAELANIEATLAAIAKADGIAPNAGDGLAARETWWSVSCRGSKPDAAVVTLPDCGFFPARFRRAVDRTRHQLGRREQTYNLGQ